MPYVSLLAAALAGALIFLMTACSGGHLLSPPEDRADCVANFDPTVDYFPDKSSVLDATNFAIAYHRSYQVLTVNNPYPGGHPVSYVLVRCGAPAPSLAGDLSRAEQIRVPVTSLFSASSTHLGMIAELDKTDVLTGVAQPAGVINPLIRQRIGAGAAVGFAPAGQLDVETVVAGHPDVLVTGGIDDPGYGKLRAAGIGVVADAEWLEKTPLGRAEWVKVFAALTGTERKAAAVYDAVRSNYRQRAADVAGITAVDVLPGIMHQGSWSMPTGAGYAGRLITDAAGSYPWSSPTGPDQLQLNFESVYARAGQAPLWLVTSGWRTLTDAVAADNRYANLAAVHGGQVWSTTGGSGASAEVTGNDYWERGTARPDLILADLIAILHPELAPQHRFEFYRRVQS